MEASYLGPSQICNSNGEAMPKASAGPGWCTAYRQCMLLILNKFYELWQCIYRSGPTLHLLCSTNLANKLGHDLIVICIHQATNTNNI